MITLITEDNFNVMVSKALDQTEKEVTPLIFYFRKKIIASQQEVELANLKLDHEEECFKIYETAIHDDGVPRSRGDYHRLYDNLESFAKEKEMLENALNERRAVLAQNKLILEILTNIKSAVNALRDIEGIKNHYDSAWWRYEFMHEAKIS